MYEEEQAAQDRKRKVAIGATVAVFGLLLLCAIVAAIVIAKRRAARHNEFVGSPSAYANPAAFWETRTSARSNSSQSKPGNYPYASVPAGLYNNNKSPFDSANGASNGASRQGSGHKGYSGNSRAKPPTCIYDASAMTAVQGADVRFARCLLCCALCTVRLQTGACSGMRLWDTGR